MSSPKVMYANGTITVARFVQLDPTVNNAVILGSLDCRTIGISGLAGDNPPIPTNSTDPPNAAIVTEDVLVYTLGMECLLRAGTGGWSNQAELYSDATGQGIPRTGGANKHIGAVALEAANVGEYGLVQVVRYDSMATAS